MLCLRSLQETNISHLGDKETHLQKGRGRGYINYQDIALLATFIVTSFVEFLQDFSHQEYAEYHQAVFITSGIDLYIQQRLNIGSVHLFRKEQEIVQLAFCYFST